MRCGFCGAPICGDCKKHLRFYKGRVPGAVITGHGIRDADQLTDSLCQCKEMEDEGGEIGVVHVSGEEAQM